MLTASPAQSEQTFTVKWQVQLPGQCSAGIARERCSVGRAYSVHLTGGCRDRRGGSTGGKGLLFEAGRASLHAVALPFCMLTALAFATRTSTRLLVRMMCIVFALIHTEQMQHAAAV